MADYTVKQVARLSGTSVRTLHYYDEIGLLAPSYVGENGYRYYARRELLRLQQILFYRDLGMPLGEIANTIDDPNFNQIKALELHRARLISELDRHQRLIRTIDTTINELRGDKTMQDGNPFRGFAPEKQQAYENELVDRYGTNAQAGIDTSKARMSKMSPQQLEATKVEGDIINKELVGLIEMGAVVEDEAVQALIARHHKWVSNFWTPDGAAYTGLGQLYLDHADFRAFYDQYDDRLVAFLAEAMRVYAETKLNG